MNGTLSFIFASLAVFSPGNAVRRIAHQRSSSLTTMERSGSADRSPGAAPCHALESVDILFLSMRV